MVSGATPSGGPQDEIRNGSEDVTDINAALERYESICQLLADAAESALSGGSAGD